MGPLEEIPKVFPENFPEKLSIALSEKLSPDNPENSWRKSGTTLEGNRGIDPGGTSGYIPKELLEEPLKKLQQKLPLKHMKKFSVELQELYPLEHVERIPLKYLKKLLKELEQDSRRTPR